MALLVRLRGLWARSRKTVTASRITGFTVLGALLMVAAVALTVHAKTADVAATTATQQRDVEAQKASDIADPITTACADGGDVAVKLRGLGLCDQAAAVKADPVVAEVTGPAGPGPTTAEIAAAVSAYLVAHPPPAGRAPTVDEITSAVADYLVAHPPTPGRAPTAAEIGAAVTDYLAAHPPAPGRDGTPGASATDAQVAAAVAAYLAAHPPAPGPPGRDGGACLAGQHLDRVTYLDGRVGDGCVDDTQPTPTPAPTTDPVAPVDPTADPIPPN